MDMSRVSACTYPLIDRPVEEALAVIAEAGFKKVDVLGRLPHFSPDPTECDYDALKAAAEAKGLRIANLGTYIGREFAHLEGADQEAALQRLRHTVDIAASLGARSIRLHLGDKDDPRYAPQLTPWLQRCAAYGAEHGVYLGIENHGQPLTGQLDTFKDLADRVGSPFFGLLYDPCNYASSGVDYRAALEILHDHIVHVHFKDGKTIDQMFTRTMLGKGDIDFAWIVDQLDEYGYQGDLALEYELKDPPVEVGLKQWHEIFAGMG